MTSRIIITKPMNFMATLILVNLMILLIGVAGTLFYVGVSGKYVTANKHTAVIAAYQEQIAILEEELVTDESNHRAEVNGYKVDIQLKDQEIGTLNVHINEMDEYADFIMTKYQYVFAQMDKYDTPNPLSYSDLVTLEKQCKKENIDPHMVLGLFNLESKFNTKAASNASSALGVAQIIKGTGKFLYNKYLGYEGAYIHKEMALDPTLAIEMSVAYLSNLMNTYENPDKALYAYNGGEIGSRYYDNINRFMASRGISKTNGRYR